MLENLTFIYEGQPFLTSINHIKHIQALITSALEKSTDLFYSLEKKQNSTIDNTLKQKYIPYSGDKCVC